MRCATPSIRGRVSAQGQGSQADVTRALGQARCLYIPEELRFSCRTTEKTLQGTRMTQGHLRTTLLAGAALLWAGLAHAASPPNMLVIGTDLSAVPSLDPAAINARTPSEVVSNLYD